MAKYCALVGLVALASANPIVLQPSAPTTLVTQTSVTVQPDDESYGPRQMPLKRAAQLTFETIATASSTAVADAVTYSVATALPKHNPHHGPHLASSLWVRSSASKATPTSGELARTSLSKDAHVTPVTHTTIIPQDGFGHDIGITIVDGTTVTNAVLPSDLVAKRTFTIPFLDLTFGDASKTTVTIPPPRATKMEQINRFQEADDISSFAHTTSTLA